MSTLCSGVAAFDLKQFRSFPSTYNQLVNFSTMESGTVTELSVSSMFGICCGYAAKRLAKDAMYGIGLAFMGLQGLVWLGYIKINWSKIEGDVVKAVDQDGDGKLTVKDAGVILRRFIGFMRVGLPNAAGFSSGFYLGIKFS